MNRNHQTAIFVDGEALKTNSSYRDRVLRLSESVNRSDTIKADVMTVFPEATVPASGIVSGIVTDPAKAESNGINFSEVAAEAAEAGYTLTLIALP